MNYETLEWIYVSVFTLSFVKIILLQLRLFTENMFNVSGTWYDKEKEKPRLFFHIVALLPFLFSLIFLKAYEGEPSGFKNTLYIIASATFIIVAVLIVLFSWSKHFENEGIYKIKEKLEQKEKIKKFKIRKDINIDEIVNYAIISKNVDERSREDLIAFLKGEKIKFKIIWIAKTLKKGNTSYKDLFTFLDNIYEDGVKGLEKNNRRQLIDIILKNFIQKDNKRFKYKNANNNYTYWLV